jgi:chromosome segregation ATPase
MKQELTDLMVHVDKAKKKESDMKDRIWKSKEEIAEFTKLMEKGVGEVEQENQQKVEELRKHKEELTGNQGRCMTKQSEIRDKHDSAMQELTIQEDENHTNIGDIGTLKEQIDDIKRKTAAEERRKTEMDGEMDKIKKKIDNANDEKAKLLITHDENKRVLSNLTTNIDKKIKDKERAHQQLHETTSKKFANEKDRESHIESLHVLEHHIDTQIEELSKRVEEVESLQKTLTKMLRENEIYTSKKLEIIRERKDLEQKKQLLEGELDIKRKAFDEKLALKGELEEDIDKNYKKREEYARTLKNEEDKEHDADGEMIGMQNHLKKLENHVRGYQIEAQKLNKIINLLEKEQEKYGVDASHAHAKYYQTLEELKIKNNLINELQKKNSELEAKLKHQQNLYEAVRSDRNLYSKNLLESQEEIGELTKKYTRMSHQVDQLKDELKVKDTSILQQDKNFQNIVEENKKTKIEKDRVKASITKTDEIVKNHEEQISRLKYIITEAQSEKQRQQKDYEMVVNERDILGSQLIKRNQELAQLYEKIKIAQSNLAKGESCFRDRQKELNQLKESLKNMKKEHVSTQDQVECIDDLKNEINSLHKDLLNQKTKVKALQDELGIKMNVHRWRKVEATDPENYERILKIQTLQRRLIAKTEEVNEKDNIIKEKEKLYMELKNILARQPGEEIHVQLTNYKESLKDKAGQMKKMLSELKQAQEQVNIFKFSIDRTKDDINSMKKGYFKKRQAEDTPQYEGNQQVYHHPVPDSNTPGLPVPSNGLFIGNSMRA